MKFFKARDRWTCAINWHSRSLNRSSILTIIMRFKYCPRSELSTHTFDCGVCDRSCLTFSSKFRNSCGLVTKKLAQMKKKIYNNLARIRSSFAKPIFDLWIASLAAVAAVDRLYSMKPTDDFFLLNISFFRRKKSSFSINLRDDGISELIARYTFCTPSYNPYERHIHLWVLYFPLWST